MTLEQYIKFRSEGNNLSVSDLECYYSCLDLARFYASQCNFKKNSSSEYIYFARKSSFYFACANALHFRIVYLKEREVV